MTPPRKKATKIAARTPELRLCRCGSGLPLPDFSIELSGHKSIAALAHSLSTSRRRMAFVSCGHPWRDRADPASGVTIDRLEPERKLSLGPPGARMACPTHSRIPPFFGVITLIAPLQSPEAGVQATGSTK